MFLLEKKESLIHDSSAITPQDFVFVKCINRRVRVPDGQAVYDGEGLKSLYRSGNMYIQLSKSFNKHKVCIIILVIIIFTTVLLQLFKHNIKGRLRMWYRAIDFLLTKECTSCYMYI